MKPDHSADANITIKIAPDDLAMIGHILHPYASFVRRVVPPSKERGLRLMVIENLRRRITTPQAISNGEQFLVTDIELNVIDAALQIFAISLLRVSPKSQQVKEVIQACEGLRRYLALSFHPAHTKDTPSI